MSYITFQPNDYFNTLLHTGNDASPRSLTGVGFQPDFVWLKRRNSASSHTLYDAVRTAGSAKGLASNSTAQEGLTATEGTTANYGYINSFDSDGFSVTTGASNDNYVNNSGDTYVSWNWKANGAGSSNTDGTTSSTVSANTTSGFSIVQHSGSGGATTIGHGLGVAPKIVLSKRTSGTNSWFFQQNIIGGSWTSSNYLILNTTAAAASSSSIVNNVSSSTISFAGGDDWVNASGSTYIHYVFAEKKGFSKFGSYSSNNNVDGNFIYTGFSPSLVYIKQTNADGESSKMYDNKRLGYNVVANWLEADDSQAEGTGSNQIDILSNGFKLRATNTAINASGGTYIYMCFAESPLVSSNGVPAVAR